MINFDVIFGWCVNLLVKWAEALGLTYNEINIWIFVIIEPLIFLTMLFIILKQQIKIRKLMNNGKVRNKDR